MQYLNFKDIIISEDAMNELFNLTDNLKTENNDIGIIYKHVNTKTGEIYFRTNSILG